jgi:hypothetical protein
MLTVVYGKVIIAEAKLSPFQKTIQPLVGDNVGVAGGSKYITQVHLSQLYAQTAGHTI